VVEHSYLHSQDDLGHNPLSGFWRVLQDSSRAGRCFPDLQHLYQRTRRALLAPYEPPVYAFRW
jgi:hypothetical protein